MNVETPPLAEQRASQATSFKLTLRNRFLLCKTIKYIDPMSSDESLDQDNQDNRDNHEYAMRRDQEHTTDQEERSAEQNHDSLLREPQNHVKVIQPQQLEIGNVNQDGNPDELHLKER